jgi:hypothetical protein
LQSKIASKNQLLLLNHILCELNFTRLDVLIFKLPLHLHLQGPVVGCVTATTKMMTPKTQSTNEDIRATIQQMATDIQELKQNRQFTTHSSEEIHRDWRGRGQASIASRNNFTCHDQRYNTTPTNRHGQNNTHSTYPNIRHQGHQSTYNRDEDRLPRCYRCGQTGHIQIGCRARLDHSRTAGLNFKRPT